MPSSYSTNLALELPATGEQSGLWGITTNTNLGTLLEQAVSGYVTQAITDGADTTITIPNGASGVARNMFLELTGALTATRNLVVPANKKLYFIYNNTSNGGGGPYAVTVKVSGQTGVSVPNGMKVLLVCNGTDVVVATNYMVSPTFLTPVLGTPTSGVLTNCTGYTVGNVSGLGTGIATALGVNVGTDGAPVVKAGALGTPSSGTLTNCSGYPGTSLTVIDAAGDLLVGTGADTAARLAIGAANKLLTSDGTTATWAYPAIVKNSQNAGYTCAATDAGGYVYMATAGSFTIPANASVAFTTNTAITFVNLSSGTCTIPITSDTMYLAGTGATGTRTLANYGMATALKVNSTTWIINGTGLS